jgi:adenylosuccinate synthase
MANTVLVGAQWGDEGKGKIIDVLTEKADVVVRSQGGNNAGHTIVIGPRKFVLHLIPSGILSRGKVCVIGNGVVMDAVALVKEIDGLEKEGVRVGKNLVLSETAHLVLPYHRMLDEFRELAKGKGKIGTTGRGIGPTYADKASRTGLRLSDLMQPKLFRQKLAARLEEARAQLANHPGVEKLQLKAIEKDYLKAAERLAPHVTNTVLYLNRCIKDKKSMLFEGAQGTFLDIDHGTYPYVTSSNTTAGGACTGSGVPPHAINSVVGVMKAYTTRVGEGPFPTEDQGLSDRLHEMGREFGATTGRARRCGWFDAVATRYAQAVNGIDSLAVTNLDGLDGVDTLRVCVGYRAAGKRWDYPPNDLDLLRSCEPIYKKFKGWRQDISGITSFKKLPPLARDYVKAIADLTGASLGIVSVGPRRDQTLFL